MKSIVLLLALLLNIANVIAQQPPQRINYQATVRDGSGNLVVSQPIGLQFNIRDLTGTGTIVYQETQTVNTNAYGILSTEIGAGTPVIGTMAGIDWANGQKWMEVEIDITGGTSYTSMGVAEMLSVPYAFYAGNTAGSLSNLTGSLGYTIYHDGTDWTSSNFLYNDGAHVGIGTTSPVARLHVADSSVVFTGFSAGSGVLSYRNPPVSGAGSRMMWYSDKSAFRTGMVNSAEWDNGNVGLQSVAGGLDVTASGNSSAAFGEGTVANSYGMVAVGLYNDVRASATPDYYNLNEQLFVVGRGNAISRANALTVLKSGHTGIGTISPAALLDVNGTVKLGTNGSVLHEVIKETVSGNYPAIGPDSAYVVTVTVPNAFVGSTVAVSPDNVLPDGLVISYARVSGGSTVEIKLYNAGTAAIPANSIAYWYVTVIR